MKRMPRTWRLRPSARSRSRASRLALSGATTEAAVAGYVGGVYQPGGYEYGRWGPGYHVGPPRGDEHGPGGRAPPPIPHNARHGGGDDHRNGAKGH